MRTPYFSNARRVDDRRVISGIVHVLKSGSRWRDCPADYGPYTTIYNRWSKQGVWEDIFYALTGQSDATYIKAHRSAAIHAMTDGPGKHMTPPQYSINLL